MWFKHALRYFVSLVSFFTVKPHCLEYVNLALNKHIPPKAGCMEQRIGDDKHMTSMKIVQFSSPPTPSCLSTPKVLPPPWPWTSNFKRSPHPLSFPNDKQSIKMKQRKHNPRMTITCYQVFPSGRLSFSVSTH